MKHNREFQSIYRRGKNQHSRSCVLFFFPKSGEKFIGFTAGKKVGNAVKRNRSKRRMRALFFEFSDKLKEGHYVLVAKEAMNSTSPAQLKSDFQKLLKRTGALS
ncbi:MAG: ribonuclease P protein component [Campylobacterota bacterium]|nr:ribonuclease P protein component [Campylobacterota bacterium]